MILHSSSTEETEAVGAGFAKKLKPGDFVALFGDLGVGKTAFVRGAASVLCPGSAVCSPSYSIINSYKGAVPVMHIDLYRITDDDDLYSTGFYDLLGKPYVIFCEWCERCPEAIPQNARRVTLTREGSGRRIEIDDTCD